MQTGQHVKLTLERGQKEDGSEDGGVPGVDWRGAALVRDQGTHVIRVLGAWSEKGCNRRLPGTTQRLAALPLGPKKRNMHGQFIALGYSREPPVASFRERIERWNEFRGVILDRPKAAPLQSNSYLFGSRLDGQKRPREHCGPLLSEKTP
jgi:hypothetical protein